MSLELVQQKNPCKIIMLTPSNTSKFFKAPVFEQMKTNKQTEFISKEVDKAQNTEKGMSSFPLPIYNQMVEYCLTHRKIRDAMFLILMANYGMRCSDVRRLRFAHIFDSNGKFRESFTLPNGEQKTKKQVIYYNNKATTKIVSNFLNLPENSRKTQNDFLFVAESGNATKTSLKDIEADDLYNIKIETVEKKLKSISNQKKMLLNICAKEKKTKDEFVSERQALAEEKAELENQIEILKAEKSAYISPTPHADEVYIQKPITKMAAENIVKNTLAKIGVFALNRKNKEQTVNFNGKLNTHSLRKVFSDQFEIKGRELKARGELNYDSDIHNLLQGKFMHSSHKVTDLYSKTEENAWKTICQYMNIGLEVLENI